MPVYQIDSNSKDDRNNRDTSINSRNSLREAKSTTKTAEGMDATAEVPATKGIKSATVPAIAGITTDTGDTIHKRVRSKDDWNGRDISKSRDVLEK